MAHAPLCYKWMREFGAKMKNKQSSVSCTEYVKKWNRGSMRAKHENNNEKGNNFHGLLSCLIKQMKYRVQTQRNKTKWMSQWKNWHLHENEFRMRGMGGISLTYSAFYLCFRWQVTSYRLSCITYQAHETKRK